MPRATTTSVWKRPQGSRSNRAGRSDSTIWGDLTPFASSRDALALLPRTPLPLRSTIQRTEGSLVPSLGRPKVREGRVALQTPEGRDGLSRGRPG